MLDEERREVTEIIAVSTDGREQQQMMIDRVLEEHGVVVDYTLLRDPGHTVIDRYGLFNEESPETRPLPHPTTLVIDSNGVVRWRMTEVDYRIRPENVDILAALRAIRPNTR